MAMTRSEHVKWTKQRALLELDAGGPSAIPNALASVQSDLRKHDSTREHAALELGGMLALGGHLQTADQVRKWIDGIQ